MGFVNGFLARAVLSASTAGGQEVVTGLHYNATGESWLTEDTQPSMEELADRLTDDLMTPWRAMFQGHWQCAPIVVTQARDPRNPLAERVQVVGGAGGAGTLGGITNDDAPLQLCGLAQLRTGGVGRSFRGRIFLPPIFSTQYLVDGLLESGSQLLTRYQTFVDAIPLEPDLVVGPAPPTQLVVYSPTRRAQDLTGYANAVTSITVVRKPVWLRSRSD